jgi:WD40 repeat protein
MLTACEADATIKLWDIRAIHTSRHHKSSTPISYTQAPDSHTAWRPFGISSMALGSDGSRLYALCKDNTVYAYSTAHLVLGHAPELSWRAGAEPPRRKHHGSAQAGLGPLYGFRHPEFHATSFYVKAAVRPARDGRSELLAVGSSDGCAVLFPTDERYMRSDLAGDMAGLVQPAGFHLDSMNQSGVPIYWPGRAAGPRPHLRRLNSFSARLMDTVPIVRAGTPLIRGHDKEVGALTWTPESGRLVTIGDDYTVRRWDESRDRAADLRRGGESGGRRWGCGWADVGDHWNGDDDDW